MELGLEISDDDLLKVKQKVAIWILNFRNITLEADGY